MKKMFEREDLKILEKRVLEPRRFIQVITGPRQVGKTTMIEQLLKKNLILAKSYSSEDVSNPTYKWIDAIWEEARQDMRRRDEKNGLLVIDEVQKVEDWARVVKKNWDKDTRDKLNLKVIILGSSRAWLQKGLSESLMGRFELIRATHWSYNEMHKAFKFTPEQYVWFGGYPGAAEFLDDEQRFRQYVYGAVVEASINKDVLMLTEIRKPALLKRLFELGVAYSSQILSYNKILGQMDDAGNSTTLARYLDMLGQSGLLAGLDMYSQRLIKVKASSPKFQVYNSALISASQLISFNEAQKDTTHWGRLVESAIGAHLLNIASKTVNMSLYYYRDGDEEVDFVLKYGDKVLGIEVKSGSLEPNYRAITRFCEKFDSSVVVVGGGSISWQDFLKTDDLTVFFK